MENDNDFFLDILNCLLEVNSTKIIMVFDEKGNIWFTLKDVIKALGYSNIDNAVNTIQITPEHKQKYSKILFSSRLEDKIKHNTIFINESGLYEVLSNSNKDLAKKFMKKYFVEIMPKIRQSGQYTVNEKDKKKLDELNNTIDNYKQEMTYYNNKYDFIPSEHGYLYINQNNSIKDGKEIQCFKIGYAKNMKKRLTEYKVGNFKHKLLCYIQLDINRKDVEKCIKIKMKPHLLKLITDTVCYTTLKDLKKEIINCIKEIKTHICHCTICKQKYTFDKLTSHKCNKIGKFIDIDKKINSIGSKGSKKSSKSAKASKGSKKGSKLVKELKESKNNSKLTKTSKGSKSAKASKESEKSSKLTKTSKECKKNSKLAKASKGSKSTKTSKGSKKNSKLVKASTKYIDL